MWAQLAMAGLKSIADNQANKQNLASNVITQKYSPWTGQRADFSAQGKNSAVSNMIAGYGSGLLQDRADAEWEANRPRTPEELKSAADKSDGDFYAKLSANPASVGVSPIGGGGGARGGFGAIANKQVPSEAPAQSAFSAPGFMQEGDYVSANRGPSSFLSQIGVDGASLAAPKASPQSSFNPWANIQQQMQRPLSPQEAQLPSQAEGSFDPTAASRQALVNALPASVPLFASIKGTDIGTAPISSFFQRGQDFSNHPDHQNRTYAPMKFPKIEPSRRPF